MKSLWILTVLTLCVVPLTFADHHEENPGYVVIHHDQVSPANAQAYEANSKAWVEAFTEAEMGPEWAWYGSQNGFTYTWVWDIDSYAYLDGQADRRKEMVEKLGEEKVASLRNGEHLVSSHSTELAKREPSLSYRAAEAPAGPPGFLRISVQQVNPSMDEKYRDLIKRSIAAHQAVGSPHSWNAYSMEFGRHAYVFVSLAKDAAEFYSRPNIFETLSKGTGSAETAQAMMAEWTECVSHYETSNSTTLNELSYLPKAPVSEASEMEETEDGGAAESE